ncbi:hypothetical protein MXB_1234 [Myxobolus squamalis]|nr:hypothetical protein MXB_1234 [Myxobolus squamalis]
MQTFRIPTVECDSCMQYIGVLEHGFHDFSLKCGIFMIFPSMIFGDNQITIWNAIIVTSMKRILKVEFDATM